MRIYVSVVGVNVVKLQGLAAELPQNGKIEMALKRNAFEDGLSDDDSQDVGSHFKEISHVLVIIKFVVSGRSLA